MAATDAAGYVTDVAYIPGFYPHMAPTAMRHAAALNRVAPPAVAGGFRYLELGCGLGRSLTTLAAANPHGAFVGVDVNPDHTAAVDRDIAAAGLANARVITAGIGDLPADVGQFEFIALHGVFSWVAPEVRAEILAVAGRHLAPGGLLLVSYNALPGWAHLQPIRSILRQYAALRQGDKVQQIHDAVRYLVFIRDKHAKYFDDNPRAAAYVDSILKQDPRYLVHEYLNEHWTSFYFAEVAGMFVAAGMAFVGSLPVHTNFWDLCVRPEFQELFRTTNNRLVTEAHKDFCANTAFRWDIYARMPRAMPELADRLRSADDLHFRVTNPGTGLPYQANLGVVSTTVQGPLYQTLLDVIGDGSLRLSEILAAAHLAGTPPADVMRAVDAGVAMGLFDVSAGPTGAAPAALAGAISIPHAYNRLVLAGEPQAGRAVALASTASGTGHMLGDLEALILQELVAGGADGLADRTEARLTAAGRLVHKDGTTITDPAERRTLLQAACDHFRTTSLPQLARMGIVAPA